MSRVIWIILVRWVILIKLSSCCSKRVALISHTANVLWLGELAFAEWYEQGKRKARRGHGENKDKVEKVCARLGQLAREAPQRVSTSTPARLVFSVSFGWTDHRPRHSSILSRPCRTPGLCYPCTTRGNADICSNSPPFIQQGNIDVHLLTFSTQCDYLQNNPCTNCTIMRRERGTKINCHAATMTIEEHQNRQSRNAGKNQPR